jgi:hypothetical protein
MQPLRKRLTQDTVPTKISNDPLNGTQSERCSHRLFAILVTRKISPSHAWLSKLAQVERLEVGIMNPQRSATVAAVLSPKKGR